MKYFCIESQSIDKYSILGLAISLNIFMPNAHLCLLCSDETYKYVNDFYDFKITIEKLDIECELAPARLIKNIVDCVKLIHESEHDAFYLSNNVIIINSLKELEDQEYNSPIVALKRDVDMKSEDAKYPMSFMLFRYSQNNTSLDRVLEYYNKHEQVLTSSHEQHLSLKDVDLEGKTDEEIICVRDHRTAALMPISKVAQSFVSTLVNEEDSVITDFFKGDRYIDVAQFYGLENKWYLNDFKVDEDQHIVRNDTKCLFTTTCIDPNTLPVSIREPAMRVWAQIEAIACFNDPRIYLAQNITNRLFGHRVVITGPKADLFGNWSRKAVPDLEKTIVQMIIKNEYLNYNQHCTNDYYRTGYSLIYDYKDESLFKGDMFSSRKSVAMLLNYNNTVLEQLNDRYIYIGLYTPYCLLVERESAELPAERNGETYHFTDDKLSVYDTEDSYVEYIKELKHYSKSFITDKTPKSHVVDCLGLGVIPVIDENCRLLEIEDIEGDTQAYLDYFKENLSIDGLSRRFIKAHMEYVQAPHEPIKHEQ